MCHPLKTWIKVCIYIRTDQRLHWALAGIGCKYLLIRLWRPCLDCQVNITSVTWCWISGGFNAYQTWYKITNSNLVTTKHTETLGCLSISLTGELFLNIYVANYISHSTTLLHFSAFPKNHNKTDILNCNYIKAEKQFLNFLGSH